MDIRQPNSLSSMGCDTPRTLCGGQESDPRSLNDPGLHIPNQGTTSQTTNGTAVSPSLNAGGVITPPTTSGDRDDAGPSRLNGEKVNYAHRIITLANSDQRCCAVTIFPETDSDIDNWYFVETSADTP